MTIIRCNLIDLCGGEDEVKKRFMQELNQQDISEGLYRLLLKAWNHGFNSCNNVIHDAVNTGKIRIIVNSDDTHPTREFLAFRKY